MKKKLIIAAVVLIVLIVITYFIVKNKKVDAPVQEVKNPVNPGSTTPAQTGNDDFPLKVGSKGENVERLQTALKKLGANIIVDGDFGQQTYSMILVTINTSAYPVTIEKFNEILKKANNS